MEEKIRGLSDAALSEDAEIDRDFEASPLPERDYDFKVVKFDLKEFEADEEKGTPACRGAVVTFMVRPEGGGRPRFVRTKLKFLASQVSRIAAFMRSVGLKKRGEPVALSALSRCVGKEGRAHFYVWSDGRSNNLGYFYDSPEAFPEQEDGGDPGAYAPDFDGPYEPEEMTSEELEDMRNWYGGEDYGV